LRADNLLDVVKKSVKQLNSFNWIESIQWWLVFDVGGPSSEVVTERAEEILRDDDCLANQAILKCHLVHAWIQF